MFRSRISSSSDESARLRAEQEYADGDRNGRTLAKVGAFRLVLVAFRRRQIRRA